MPWHNKHTTRTTIHGVAPPVGNINEREAADEELELIRCKDAQKRKWNDFVDPKEELRELVGDALHHDVPQSKLKVLIEILSAYFDLTAPRFELNDARDAKLRL